jgi:hypothetical protein
MPSNQGLIDPMFTAIAKSDVTRTDRELLDVSSIDCKLLILYHGLKDLWASVWQGYGEML